ncbi:hypothetical protein [Deinococcus seoulensis]|nr:hypothetical protein [Deinococcus seoulensis]
MMRSALMTLSLTLTAAPALAVMPAGPDRDAIELLAACALEIEKQIASTFTNPTVKSCQDPKLELAKNARVMYEGVVVNTKLKTSVKGNWLDGNGQIKVTSAAGRGFTYHRLNLRAGLVYYILPDDLTLAKQDDRAVQVLFSCRAALSRRVDQTFDPDSLAPIKSCADSRLKLMSDYGFGKTPLNAVPAGTVVRYTPEQGLVLMELEVAVNTRGGQRLTLNNWVRGGLTVPAYLSLEGKGR